MTDPVVQLTVRLPNRPSIRRAVRALREGRSFRRAARRMPNPVPWDWAEPRILPLFAGPWFDEDEPPVRTVSSVGPALNFGFPLGRGWGILDEDVVERWECTPAQIEATAMANLARRAAALEPGVVRGATMSGLILRRIENGPSWASSLLLLPDELKRLFGSHDQIFGVPGRAMLVSFSADAPMALVGRLLVELEQSEVYPLLLDAFLLADGELAWCWDDDDGFDEGD